MACFEDFWEYVPYLVIFCCHCRFGNRYSEVSSWANKVCILSIVEYVAFFQFFFSLTIRNLVHSEGVLFVIVFVWCYLLDNAEYWNVHFCRLWLAFFCQINLSAVDCVMIASSALNFVHLILKPFNLFSPNLAQIIKW